jgi:hypothetical protein
MMATVVLGIAAAGVLLPFASGAAVRAEGMRRTLAAKLASDLMEEIITKPFHDPDGSSYDYSEGRDDGETSVEDFDNIDDFHGYSESQGQIRDATWTVFTDAYYAKFSRDVSCEYVTVPQQPADLEKEQCNFVRVTVRVYYSDKQVATVSRLIADR